MGKGFFLGKKTADFQFWADALLDSAKQLQNGPIPINDRSVALLAAHRGRWQRGSVVQKFPQCWGRRRGQLAIVNLCSTPPCNGVEQRAGEGGIERRIKQGARLF